MELEAMSRYTSPVNPAVFPHLTVVLLAIGMFFTAWFFVYEVTSTKYTRDIYKELLISLVASLFMGFGVLFLLLWEAPEKFFLYVLYFSMGACFRRGLCSCQLTPASTTNQT
uniref:Dolichyl-diphosphooligosaccharide-protein glycosyltransferase subunit TMEM258 n=1 Tax=Gallus gallus TaxID=9031 RepID=A0A8V0ZIE8_CHICK